MKDYQKFWEHGIAVFSLYPMQNGKCTCGNPYCDPKNAGKHPVASNWQNTPVWSDEQMEPIIQYDLYDHGYGGLCCGLLS